MIDWSELEAQIGLEALPAFHRAFLESRGVDVTGMMLRRVQQTVEREINKIVLEGKARREDTRIWIDPVHWLVLDCPASSCLMVEACKP